MAVGKARLEDFADRNQCKVAYFQSLADFQKDYAGYLNFPGMPAGRYAEVSCRVRDETAQ